MKFTIITLLILTIIGYFGLNYLSQPISVDFTEAIDPFEDPNQSEIFDFMPFAMERGRTKIDILPVADYRITGRVLSKRPYKRDWTGKISPLDVALGWGSLASEDMIDCAKFDQWGRFYFYTINRDCHINYNYLATHSANIHLIPASPNIRKALKHINKGDIIQLRGYLVNLRGEHKGKRVSWNTSTVRNDSGNGSCEIIYLVRLVIGDRSYI